MLEQLEHKGILISQVPVPSHLALTIRGELRELSCAQIEMAMAWAKKQGTPYVEDGVFVENFVRDFSAAMGIRPVLKIEEVDFAPALEIVMAERAAKERLTREEKKELAAQRKAERELLKEQYGYATVNGDRVEIAGYVAEPSGIFMGRGRHPLRGRWKEGPRQSDVTLNHSPGDLLPEGEWAEIVWQPESLWVARWKDKLSGKLKYVWLSDAASVKQEREAAKFDQAVRLHENISRVREQIERDLTDSKAKRRRLATVCHLIDVLCLRVGDEKDADEADTVGATTLRPEHVTLHEDGTAEFRFLGKDSVLWHKKVSLHPVAWQNLEKLINEAQPSSSAQDDASRLTRDKPQIFPGIGSSDVNSYLSKILPGVSAKVFRTHHATQAVRQSLEASGVVASDPDYRKWGALSLANLEAAELCNHYKKGPDNWRERRARASERLAARKERVAEFKAPVREARKALEDLRAEAREKKESAKTDAQREKLRVRYAKKTASAQKKLETAKGRMDRARAAFEKAETQDTVTVKKRTWNLSTSLKSYIDPRVVYDWGERVEYDVLEQYYPKALRLKFAWVRDPERADEATDTFSEE